ncbi:MAG: hypothetical protein K6F33_13335 [Bacteroidales bacterium]|nr:hypothetical protein [Bacteroidales bacterium]
MVQKNNFAFVDEACNKYGIAENVYDIMPSQMADCSFLTAVYRECCFNYPKFHKMDDLSKACFLATEMAVCSLTAPLDAQSTGVVFFNREGSLITDRNFEKTICDPENFYPSPSVFVYTLPNILTGEICIRHGFQGESLFYVIDSRDEDAIQNIVDDMLTCHSAVVCGWSEVNDGNIKAEVAIYKSDIKNGAKC